jgi:hypothetical protein
MHIILCWLLLLEKKKKFKKNPLILHTASSIMDFKQRLLTFKDALTIAYTKPFVKLPALVKKKNYRLVDERSKGSKLIEILNNFVIWIASNLGCKCKKALLGSPLTCPNFEQLTCWSMYKSFLTFLLKLLAI